MESQVEKAELLWNRYLLSSRKHKANLIWIPVKTSDELLVELAMTATPAKARLWDKVSEAESSPRHEKRTGFKVSSLSSTTMAIASHAVLKVKWNKHGQAKTLKARFTAGDINRCTSVITTKIMLLSLTSWYVCWYWSKRFFWAETLVMLTSNRIVEQGYLSGHAHPTSSQPISLTLQ